MELEGVYKTVYICAVSKWLLLVFFWTYRLIGDNMLNYMLGVNRIVVLNVSNRIYIAFCRSSVSVFLFPSFPLFSESVFFCPTLPTFSESVFFCPFRVCHTISTWNLRLVKYYQTM